MANISLKAKKQNEAREHDALALAQLIYDIWIEKKTFQRKKNLKT